MNEWLLELARALEVEPPSGGETGALLKLTRDVAHGTERRLAPLSAFLIGRAVGGGLPVEEALERTRALVPPPPADGGATEGSPEGPPAG
jgi:Domain of unknown function (DUF6457)